MLKLSEFQIGGSKLEQEPVPVMKDEMLQPVVDSIKGEALDFANRHKADNWLLNSLEGKKYLDGVVSEMRHLKGGQIFILERLKQIAEDRKIDLNWNRGGTRTRWNEVVGNIGDGYYTIDQLDLNVIDGGGDGVLGRSDVSLGFLTMITRKEPVVYTLTLEDLIWGLKNNAINLISHHEYDLSVTPKDRISYLDFCKERLKIREG